MSEKRLTTPKSRMNVMACDTCLPVGAPDERFNGVAILSAVVVVPGAVDVPDAADIPGAVDVPDVLLP
jgi:hypothetical protein